MTTIADIFSLNSKDYYCPCFEDEETNELNDLFQATQLVRGGTGVPTQAVLTPMLIPVRLASVLLVLAGKGPDDQLPEPVEESVGIVPS